jgi:uncharacterized protein YndB with AHSA1/START domain
MTGMQAGSRLIEQSILIRAPRSRVFAALTDRDDIAAWWGAVSPDPIEDGDLWPGVGDEFPRIRVKESRPDELLAQHWDQPLPHDPSRTAPNDVRFELSDLEDGTLVTMRHAGIPVDADWADMFDELHHGWPQELRFLQAWVESGRRRKDMKNPDRFATVTRSIAVDADQAWVWRALTDSALLGQWLDADVTCTPKIGGAIDILWPDGSHVGGEIVLFDAPHHLIMHWWDADSWAQNNDPGMITVLLWTLRPVGERHTQLDLLDTGYDLSRVNDEWMTEIHAGWDQFLASLQAMAREEAAVTPGKDTA